MLDIVFEWICWAFGQFLLAVVLVPWGSFWRDGSFISW